jgi:hypothetical protein
MHWDIQYGTSDQRYPSEIFAVNHVFKPKPLKRNADTAWYHPEAKHIY